MVTFLRTDLLCRGKEEPSGKDSDCMEIFVSNLAYQVQDNELRDLFTPYGEVRRAAVVKDRETGRSRGFGFVDMPDPAAGARAVAELNGKPFQSRPLMVSEARPRQPGQGPAAGGGAGFAPRPPRPAAGPSGFSPAAGAPRSYPPGGTSGFSPRPPAAGDSRPYAPRPMSPPSHDLRGEGEFEQLSPRLEDAKEAARRARVNTFGKDKRKNDHFEEPKRKPALKGVEKGRRNNPRLNPDDDEEEDILPVRIR